MARPARLKPRVAAAALAKDPAFGPWVERIGSVRIPRLDLPPFAYLVRAICHQQLAGAAARTIHGRFVDVLDADVSPASVLSASEAAARGSGLSAAKLAAVRDLAEKVVKGDVRLDDVDRQPDEEVVRRLTDVRGIGVWTAQMFLLFRLRRADVWPVGDLGVRRGYALIHGLEDPPSARELEPLGHRLRPWRSAAAWYCYRALES